MKPALEKFMKESGFVKKEDIERIKQLLYDYGMKYYVAVNEADQICGKLVHSICKDGCLSDDMDMFVYKSKYVYRNFKTNTKMPIAAKAVPRTPNKATDLASNC